MRALLLIAATVLLGAPVTIVVPVPEEFRGADEVTFEVRASGEMELFATEGLDTTAVHVTRMKPGDGLVGEIMRLSEQPDPDKARLSWLANGILGVGGTGSYILDLIAMTTVAEIQLFVLQPTAVDETIFPSDAKSWCPIAIAPDFTPSTISPTPPSCAAATRGSGSISCSPIRRARPSRSCIRTGTSPASCRSR